MMYYVGHSLQNIRFVLKLRNLFSDVLTTADPKNTLKQVTILPMNSSLIMSKIAVDIPCHYKVPLTFNTKYIMMTKPEKVSLRLSIMGKPGLQEWQISYMCEENSSLFLSEEVEVGIIIY